MFGQRIQICKKYVKSAGRECLGETGKWIFYKLTGNQNLKNKWEEGGDGGLGGEGSGMGMLVSERTWTNVLNGTSNNCTKLF